MSRLKWEKLCLVERHRLKSDVKFVASTLKDVVGVATSLMRQVSSMIIHTSNKTASSPRQIYRTICIDVEKRRSDVNVSSSVH